MLEILAGVRYCHGGQFEDLRVAILEQRASLSGSILILLDWDRKRRELVNELLALGLPLQIFLVVADENFKVDQAVPNMQVLTAGKMQQGLLSG